MIKTKKLPDFARRYSKAMAYAAKKHATQTRKGTSAPYISHPIAVSSLVLESGGNEDEAIAALLHDVAEDCGGQPALKKIRRRFGKKVARIVEGCTDTLEEQKPAWKERKVKYLAHLRKADKSVALVSAADKLHNARSILSDYRAMGEKMWDVKKFSGDKKDVLWYYRALADEFKAKGDNRLARELDLVVTEIERIATVNEA